MNTPKSRKFLNTVAQPVIFKSSVFAISVLALSVLAACGGGGSGTDSTGGTGPSTPTPEAPSPTNPTAPTVPPVSNDASCAEAGSVLTVAGNTAQVDGNVYYTDGSTIISTQQLRYATSNTGSFRGRTNLFQLNQVNTTTYTNAAVNGTFGGSVITATENSYSSVVGDVRQTYGLTVSTLFQGKTNNVSSYFTPYAYTGATVNPALATPYVASYSTTTEVDGVAQPALAQTSTTTYTLETVNVLAGTFPACKLKVEVSAASTPTTVSYGWQVASGRYKGLIVRTANGDGVKTWEATRLLVNGQ